MVLAERQPGETAVREYPVAQPATENARRARLLRLQAAALATAANAIYITKVDGRIVWVNAAFTRLTSSMIRRALPWPARTPRGMRPHRMMLDQGTRPTRHCSSTGRARQRR